MRWKRKFPAFYNQRRERHNRRFIEPPQSNLTSISLLRDLSIFLSNLKVNFSFLGTRHSASSGICSRIMGKNVAESESILCVPFVNPIFHYTLSASVWRPRKHRDTAQATQSSSPLATIFLSSLKNTEKEREHIIFSSLLAHLFHSSASIHMCALPPSHTHT
jgi:hypothetical protein